MAVGLIVSSWDTWGARSRPGAAPPLGAGPAQQVGPWPLTECVSPAGPVRPHQSLPWAQITLITFPLGSQAPPSIPVIRLHQKVTLEWGWRERLWPTVTPAPTSQQGRAPCPAAPRPGGPAPEGGLPAPAAAPCGPHLPQPALLCPTTQHTMSAYCMCPARQGAGGRGGRPWQPEHQAVPLVCRPPCQVSGPPEGPGSLRSLVRPGPLGAPRGPRRSAQCTDGDGLRGSSRQPVAPSPAAAGFRPGWGWAGNEL